MKHRRSLKVVSGLVHEHIDSKLLSTVASNQVSVALDADACRASARTRIAWTVLDFNRSRTTFLNCGGVGRLGAHGFAHLDIARGIWRKK